MSVVHDVLVLHEKQAYVAKKYDISISRISSIVSEAKKSNDYIGEVFKKQSVATAGDIIIAEEVEALNSKDPFIDSKAAVAESIKASTGLDCKPHKIGKVMTAMGMKYRKINHIPL